MKIPVCFWLIAMLVSISPRGISQPHTVSAETGSGILDPDTKAQRNVGVLIDLLKHKCLNDPKYDRAPSFHYFLATAVGAEVVRSLYIAAISQLIKEQPAEAVAAYMWDIHRRDGGTTYALMAEMQLELFSTKYKALHNDAYLNDLAYYLYNIRNNVLFDGLETTVRNALEFAIQSLPGPLYQFYFASQFCLVNKHYDEYAYSSEFIVGGRRLVYTWLNPYMKAITPSTQYIWQKHVVDSLVDGAAVKGRANFVVSLHAKAYENYIYMDHRKENRIYGWPNGNEVDGSFWRVHFVSDSMAFEQQGVFMCGSSELGYEEKRRYIDGIGGSGTTAVNDTCRWYVQECPFKENVLGTWFGSWFP